MRNLIANARIGVGADERERPQALGIDIEVWGLFARAAEGDRLEETVDYADLAGWIRGFCAGGEWRLLERLAEELAAGLLERYSAVVRVGLTLRKWVLPAAECVEYAIDRQRAPASGG